MPEDCGTKHLKLAGLIVSVTCLIVGGMFGYCLSSLSAYETRLRAVEQSSVRIETRLSVIQESLVRIEADNRRSP